MTVRPISSYPALLAEIADWADRISLNDGTNPDVIQGRPNLGPVAPSFVTLAESMMRRRLSSRQLTTTIEIALDADGGFDLPCDFAGLVSLVATPQSDGRYFPMLMGITQDALAEQQRIQTYGYNGQPQFYAVSENRINFAPLPTQGTNGAAILMGLTYRRSLPQLTLMSPSNWMLASNPDVYLYGSLTHAAMYLKDYDLAPQMQAAFDRAVEDVNVEATRQSRPAVNRMRVGMLV